MPQLFTNNAFGSLAGSVNGAATTFVLASGNGAKFPAPTGGDYFLATLIGLDGNGAESVWEIVKCTARSTDQLTVVRAQEGTTATTWNAGTRIEIRWTAAGIAGKEDSGTASSSMTTHLSAVDPHSQYSNTDHTHAVATISVNGLMASTDKTKLDGIASGATNYSHPTNHAPSIITQDSSNRFVTDTEKTTWNAKASSSDISTAINTERTATVTLTNKTFTGYTETVYNLVGTDIAVANGTIQYKTLSANTTFTESLADGQSIVLMLNPYTFTTTWPTVTWVGSTVSTAPTLVASVFNCITLFQIAGVLYGRYEGRV